MIFRSAFGQEWANSTSCQPCLVFVPFPKQVGRECHCLLWHLAAPKGLVVCIQPLVIDTGFADREDSVAALPVEVGQAGRLFLQPLGGFCFCLFDHVLDREFAGQEGEDVNVVGDTADEDGGRIDVVLEYRSLVGVEFPAEIGIGEPGSSMLGAVDQVDQDSC